VVFVIVIFTLKKILALVVLLDLGQSHETKDYWNNDDISWNLLLEAKIPGT
jgi:hypothetical protein